MTSLQWNTTKPYVYYIEYSLYLTWPLSPVMILRTVMPNAVVSIGMILPGFGWECPGTHFNTKTILSGAGICITICRPLSWWRHQMETFSALLAICAGSSPVRGEFPTQRPVTRSFDVFFDLRMNKRLSKQSWGWWFETLSRPLWRHCNGILQSRLHITSNIP